MFYSVVSQQFVELVLMGRLNPGRSYLSFRSPYFLLLYLPQIFLEISKVTCC